MVDDDAADGNLTDLSITGGSFYAWPKCGPLGVDSITVEAFRFRERTMVIRPSHPLLFVAAAAAAIILSGCAAGTGGVTTRRVDLLGAPVSEQAGQRTIIITPDTVSVNVTGGETVRFVSGTHSFAWSFQVSNTVTMFDLNQVAPPGMLPHSIPVYVAPNPLYISNS